MRKLCGPCRSSIGRADAIRPSRHAGPRRSSRRRAARAATATAHAKALAALENTHRATIAALDDALADALPPLALAVARALLAVEPSPHIIAALSAQAISALPPDSAGTLRIAPGQPLPQVPGWTVLEDASLPPATVRAELDCTRVTASLAGRLEQIARELSA